MTNHRPTVVFAPLEGLMVASDNFKTSSMHENKRAGVVSRLAAIVSTATMRYQYCVQYE
jgi:hypothetical protein